VENKGLVSPTDGMTGIGTTLVARHDINVFAEKVDDLSLPFITPLTAYYDADGHIEYL